MKYSLNTGSHTYEVATLRRTMLPSRTATLMHREWEDDGSGTYASIISNYSFTAGSYSPDGKNNFRGYAAGQYLAYGSTTDVNFSLGDGTIVTMAGVAVYGSGTATYEYIPQSGVQFFALRFIRSGSTSFPTFNDADWFKTLRIINNTANTTEDIARSAFSTPSLSNDGTNGMATLQVNRTATMTSGDSITIQLRSD